MQSTPGIGRWFLGQVISNKNIAEKGIKRKWYGSVCGVGGGKQCICWTVYKEQLNYRMKYNNFSFIFAKYKTYNIGKFIGRPFFESWQTKFGSIGNNNKPLGIVKCFIVCKAKVILPGSDSLCGYGMPKTFTIFLVGFLHHWSFKSLTLAHLSRSLNNSE